MLFGSWRLIPEKVGADGDQTALAYRYMVTPNVNIHAYKPKELPSDVDRAACRSTQLGAAWCGRFIHLPRTGWCDLLWEVPCLLLPVNLSKVDVLHV